MIRSCIDQRWVGSVECNVFSSVHRASYCNAALFRGPVGFWILHVHTCIHGCMHVYLHTYMHEHEQRWVHTCIHTCIETHTYTHIVCTWTWCERCLTAANSWYGCEHVVAAKVQNSACGITTDSVYVFIPPWIFEQYCHKKTNQYELEWMLFRFPFLCCLRRCFSFGLQRKLLD